MLLRDWLGWPVYSDGDLGADALQTPTIASRVTSSASLSSSQSYAPTSTYMRVSDTKHKHTHARTHANTPGEG